MDSSSTGAPTTSRSQAKAARRADLLTAAAAQMAQRGFAAVRLEDIGAQAGISGPAMYRHFSSKTDVLDTLLLEISERLYDGGNEVCDQKLPPYATLVELIEFHIEVLVTKPDVIVVQDRDLSSLTPEANHRVRLLQRRYVERWVDVVEECVSNGLLPTMSRDDARIRVHAMFGLLNSSPRLPATPAARLRPLLTAMALAALGADARPD
ncbi:putative TetR family transcriptional regulator [Gordonia effusa NBRC 100432]|uniref:Putative TetR family transcriptional regulator n=1 Tax=Gordonia effusa NBRC 100432 TaxID=1077974 RepID=H0R1L2_9ACTN|nr:TetR family transcriptional regulator [Gordonia effusa]GAB18963.1 putative TetR family transcriptional regulator [Gordonia effusa NBRC 100432]